MEFVVEHAHSCLPGHFPGRPLVPGVLVLDHVLAAIERGHGLLGALRLPQVKFASPLLPGQVARVELEGAAPRWRFRVLRGDASGGDVLVASGEVALA
ncbi:hypothetical protein H9645_04370 [Luteimonas sp. Sa2BVA3]|jgi:3-hydroxyacyl-[acyl-carrier-protein] dehydratase|uniref:ApeI dehydratase-like domain-containing protein n=1 Tax=Luteimonas colneyensis TaxID=2762230 RepID=A0ABR8UGV2_9GAMM|nr:hypothetical protein [Luteimonas colneyensis]MBD7987256.1 hypothetical protein [Luteimonas colneyensis]